MMTRLLLGSTLETLIIEGNVLKLVTEVVSCTVMGEVGGVANSWPLMVTVHLDELVGIRVPGTEQSNLAVIIIIVEQVYTPCC